MIKIKIYKKNNKIESLEVKGHAFYGKKGTDIVCAAISALLQNIYVGFSKIEDIKLDYKAKDGSLYLTILNVEDLKEIQIEKINFLFETTIESIQLISSNYKTKLEIIKKEV